jgi:probable rRNA maturation factor
MTFYVENETDVTYDFDVEQIVEMVAMEVLDTEECPYEAQINVLLTDNEGIREFNKEYRDIDRETDVLSFPNLDFEQPGDFEIDEDMEADYFDPDTGELILGDIIISVDKVEEQAQSYGHSKKREFAFLVAHSMLHLCGYDHMEPEEAAVMEAKQEAALTKLGITRD